MRSVLLVFWIINSISTSSSVTISFTSPWSSHVKTGRFESAIYMSRYESAQDEFPRNNENWGNQGPRFYNDGTEQSPQDYFSTGSIPQDDMSSENTYRQNSYDRQPQQYWGDSKQTNADRERQEGYYYDPRPPVDRREYQQKQERYRGDYGQNIFNERAETFYDEPQPPDYGPQHHRGGFGGDGDRGENYYYEPQPPQESSLEGDNNFDRRQPPGGRQREQYVTGNAREWKMMKKRRFNRRRFLREQGGMIRDERFGFGSPGMPGGPMNPFGGFGMMDRAMDEMMDPFAGFEMMGQMIDRLNYEIEDLHQRQILPIDDLLDDAMAYLLDDPSVTDTLGDEIRLGLPFAQSSSSAAINGANRFRVQLGIPITGTQGSGSVRLMANEGGITRLAVNVGDRVIDVRVGERRRYESTQGGKGQVIDANLLDKEEDN